MVRKEATVELLDREQYVYYAIVLFALIYAFGEYVLSADRRKETRAKKVRHNLQYAKKIGSATSGGEKRWPATGSVVAAP